MCYGFSAGTTWKNVSFLYSIVNIATLPPPSTVSESCKLRWWDLMHFYCFGEIIGFCRNFATAGTWKTGFFLNLLSLHLKLMFSNYHHVASYFRSFWILIQIVSFSVLLIHWRSLGETGYSFPQMTTFLAQLLSAGNQQLRSVRNEHSWYSRRMNSWRKNNARCAYGFFQLIINIRKENQ